MLEIMVATVLIAVFFAIISLLAFSLMLQKEYNRQVSRAMIRRAMKSIAEEMKDKENGNTSKIYEFEIDHSIFN